MKVINEQIKTGEFQSVYLLYGEEEYLKKQYRDKLKKAISGDDTMNYSYFEGNKIVVKEVIDMANTLPFFAQKRLIIIENSGFFKSSQEELADFIKNMPDYLIFVFVESEVDKRNKVYKAVSTAGYICEMKQQSTSVLVQWIVTLLKNEGKTIDRPAVDLLLSKTGAGMDLIYAEVEKLVSYCIDRQQITAEDVEAVCTTQTTSRIFDMITAIATKKQKQALDLYYDLLLLKEPPMRILYLLTRQFKLLMEVKDLVGKRYDKSSIAKTVGLHPFVAGKYMQQCRTFEKKELRTILEEAVDTEEMVKTGRLNDVMSVELFIVKYSAA